MGKIASYRDIGNKTDITSGVSNLDRCPSKKQILGKGLDESMLTKYNENQLVKLVDIEKMSKIKYSSFPGNEHRDLNIQDNTGYWVESTDSKGVPVWKCTGDKEMICRNNAYINIDINVEENWGLHIDGSVLLIRYDHKTMDSYTGLFSIQDVDDGAFAMACIYTDHFDLDYRKWTGKEYESEERYYGESDYFPTWIAVIHGYDGNFYIYARCELRDQDVNVISAEEFLSEIEEKYKNHGYADFTLFITAEEAKEDTMRYTEINIGNPYFHEASWAEDTYLANLHWWGNLSENGLAIYEIHFIKKL